MKCYCKYIIDKLKKDISQALSHLKLSTMLGYYKSGLKKLDLYKEKVVYGRVEWKKPKSHKKTWSVHDDR